MPKIFGLRPETQRLKIWAQRPKDPRTPPHPRGGMRKGPIRLASTFYSLWYPMGEGKKKQNFETPIFERFAEIENFNILKKILN